MSPRRGIEVKPSVDRGTLILNDPDGYYREARRRAEAIVERDRQRAVNSGKRRHGVR